MQRVVARRALLLSAVLIASTAFCDASALVLILKARMPFVTLLVVSESANFTLDDEPLLTLGTPPTNNIYSGYCLGCVSWPESSPSASIPTTTPPISPPAATPTEEEEPTVEENDNDANESQFTAEKEVPSPSQQLDEEIILAFLAVSSFDIIGRLDH